MDGDPNFTPDAPQAGRKAQWPLGMSLSTLFRDCLLSLMIVFLAVVFLYEPCRVEGTSMLPELANDQLIFVNKFVYRFDNIERGDIVIFSLPEDASNSYIKRVVGLPGETVEVRRGQVYIDGRPIREEQIAPRYRDFKSFPTVTVPEGEYYVLGDQRSYSRDSRVWGTIARSLITGKATFAYWPPERFGAVH